MADRGNGGEVDVVRIGKHGAIFQQALNATVILRTKTREVVITKLINSQRHQQLWLFISAQRGYARKNQDKDQAQPASFLHSVLSPDLILQQIIARAPNSTPACREFYTTLIIATRSIRWFG